MKKHTCLASAGIVLYNTIASTLLGLLALLFHPLAGLSVFVCFNIFFYILFRNAYQIIHMDEVGIRNRHVSIKWNDITEIRYFNLREELGKGRSPKIPYCSAVGIGNPSEHSFLGQNVKSTVLFSVTKKNMNAIRTLCKEKNDAVNEILSWEMYAKFL